MASLDLTLSAHFRDSYFAMLDCAREIALTHGEDAAIEWAGRTLNADFDLFVKVEVTPTRPTLYIVST